MSLSYGEFEALDALDDDQTLDYEDIERLLAGAVVAADDSTTVAADDFVLSSSGEKESHSRTPEPVAALCAALAIDSPRLARELAAESLAASAVARCVAFHRAPAAAARAAATARAVAAPVLAAREDDARRRDDAQLRAAWNRVVRERAPRQREAP